MTSVPDGDEDNGNTLLSHFDMRALKCDGEVVGQAIVYQMGAGL